MGNQKREVNVLLVSLPSQGLLNPMLMFAKVLISKGVHVTLATTDLGRKMFDNGTVSTNTTNFDVEFFSDGFSEDFDRDKISNLDQYFKSLPTKSSPHLSDLVKKLSEVKKFSCIITNPFFSWAADVATQHGIPCAMLWIQPCALYAIYYRYYKDLNPFPSLENLDFLVNLPGIPLLDVNELPSFIHPSNSIPSLTKGLGDMIESLDKVKWVLGNSFYELEKEVVDSMEQLKSIIPIGPLVPPAMFGKEDMIEGGVSKWKAEDTCLEWLDKKPHSSVVYISFGSITVFSNKQMENIALALKSTKKPFLLVVKPKITKDGIGELPSWFIEETQEQGRIVPWCTQTRVLTHPSISCFMSHCGWNSLLEAIVSGVPVIGFPQWTDQPTNAKLLTHLFQTGVKYDCKDEEGVISKEEIERCILEITEGPKAEAIKIRSKELKEAAMKAVSHGGSSDSNLHRFIDELSG